MTRKEKIAGIEEFLRDSRAELAHGATAQYADSIRQTIAQCELQLGKLTRPAALRQSEKKRLMRNMGLVRVRGALGGIYWE